MAGIRRSPTGTEPSKGALARHLEEREALEALATAVARKVRPAQEAHGDDVLPFVPRGGHSVKRSRPGRRWGDRSVDWRSGERSAPLRGPTPTAGPGPERVPPLLDESWAMVRERLRGRALVFFIDYDGTLAWIASRPELAKLPMAAKISLERLARRHPVHLVSGRSRSDLQTLVRVPGVRYQGCHGFELDVAPPPLLEGLDLRGLDLLEAALTESLAGQRGVFFERKQHTLAVHYRLAAPGAEAHLRSTLYRLLPEVDGWSCEPGRCVFEIRPSVRWGKGEAIQHLLEQSDLPENVLPISIGDDGTDESAFRALAASGLTIHVDSLGRASAAQYRVRNPTEVHVFLDRIVEELR